MTLCYALAALLVVFFAWRFRRWLRHRAYIEPAIHHVRNLQDGNVEEGLIAAGGSLGVIYLPKVSTELHDVIVVYVRAAYFRGGCPEHERFHLVQMDRAKKTVLQCDTVDLAK